MGKFDIELGNASGVVRGQGEVHPAPPYVDVWVVIHLLGLDCHARNRGDPIQI